MSEKKKKKRQREGEKKKNTLLQLNMHGGREGKMRTMKDGKHPMQQLLVAIETQIPTSSSITPPTLHSGCRLPVAQGYVGPGVLAARTTGFRLTRAWSVVCLWAANTALMAFLVFPPLSFVPIL